MHDDLIDAVDWAVAQGYADPGRVGIFGGSYGGYAALVGVTVTPEKFAAAVDYVGISDLASFLSTLPPFVRANMTNNWIAYVGDPDDPDALADMRRSIAHHHGRPDPHPAAGRPGRQRRPRRAGRVRQHRRPAARTRGAVEYLVADDEGHGFENPENQVMLFRAIERHLAAHLGGRSAETT